MALTNQEMIAGRFAKWATARRKMAFIQAQIAAGRTVYITTMTKSTKITAKHLSALRVTKFGGLELQSGKGWLDCNWCQIAAR